MSGISTQPEFEDLWSRPPLQDPPPQDRSLIKVTWVKTSKITGKQESYVGSLGFRRTCPRVGLSWKGLLTGQAAG